MVLFGWCLRGVVISLVGRFVDHVLDRLEVVWVVVHLGLCSLVYYGS